GALGDHDRLGVGDHGASVDRSLDGFRLVLAHRAHADFLLPDELADVYHHVLDQRHQIDDAPFAHARFRFAFHQVDHNFPGLVNRRADTTSHLDVFGHRLPGVTATSAFIDDRDANRPAHRDHFLDH